MNWYHRFFCLRLPFLTLFAISLVACGKGDRDTVAPATSEPATVAAPTAEDPVSEWELQYLPAIDAHMKAGRLDSVITVCQLALQQDSTRIVLYNLMASAYASQGRDAMAIDALERAVRLSPQFTAGWVNLGGIHSRHGRFSAAVPFLERAAKLDPASAAARRRLGHAYLQLGQTEQALASIDAAMDLLPEDATLNFLRGEALGRGEEALASFLRAGALDPGYLVTHERAATLARRLGHSALADSCLALHGHLLALAAGDTVAATTRKRLRGAITNAPEDAITHARLGGFYLYYDYMPEALALMGRAASLEQTDASLLNELGGLLSKKGRPEALDYYRRALEVRPDFGPALINAGGVLNAMDRHQEALSYFKRAVALAPQDGGARFYLAVTHLSLDQRDEAHRLLSEARELVADDEDLRQQIEAALATIDDLDGGS
ncbi:MAG: tetratricopeptide repeat protein [Candidatus Latescibacteria bacterium]|jgi:tetratricopeptide (TPR) repeat protein|nr:hypothetical protein [Gemmatimonadaceae bacterium]MDP6015748.1 tetratricopeptide repeat protein [Candidatus Latescibacterota bacterium]MDP7449951.1 tetratricopeptide repeat protein [Candidatus Latescibacterota bacterium]HJP29693.1 tetratricopeptide repeat protein [Candidatus Latescibacterota bacterium]